MNKKHLHFLLSFFAVIAFSQASAQTHVVTSAAGKNFHQRTGQQSINPFTSISAGRLKNHQVPAVKRQSNQPADAASGYLYEGFEGSVFPPSGWFITTSIDGSSWFQSDITDATGGFETGGGHFGNFFATDPFAFEYESDWLVTPGFTVASGDSAKFWLAPVFAGFPPDSLEVLISTTGQDPTTNTFTRLDLLYDGNGYPTSDFEWEQLKYDLTPYAGQTVYIAFRHANDDGDGIAIDDVQLGTPPADEVGTQSVNLPASAGLDVPTTLSATVFNLGGSSPDFNVTIKGSDGFTSTKTVSGLGAFQTAIVNFDPWTPDATGSYTFTAYTTLAGDTTFSDDTAIGSAPVLVLSTFKNYGWVSKTSGTVNAYGPGIATWKYQFCDSCDPEINEFGGAGAFSGATKTQQQIYTASTDSWKLGKYAPVGLIFDVPQTIKNDCYIIGGTTGAATNALTFIWDNVGKTWNIGKSIPIPVFDYAGATYHDSLIYVVMGYDGFQGYNNVQIYDPAKNKWYVGTPTPGDPISGCRGAIVGNKIIIAGGQDLSTFALSNQVLVGDIDTTDPTQINWESRTAFPGGAIFRLGAGANFVNDSLAYFTGGDPTGTGLTVSKSTYAYNPYTDEWFAGPDKITGVNNLENLSPIMFNDSIYMAVYGGYNGHKGSNALEWLNLGPVPPPVSTGVHNVSSLLNHLSATTNPFSSTAKVNLNLDVAHDVTIEINDLLGRTVAVLFQGKLQAGAHTFIWDASKFATGIYFCHAQFENNGETLKLIKQ
jgi:hypothetical protein